MRGRRSQRPDPTSWRAAFQATVMRTGMVLSLTQPMLEFLCACADGVRWDRSVQGASTLARPDCFLATARSLEKRGLVRRRPPADVQKLTVEHHLEVAFHELTEAGDAVVHLLKVTGVFTEADASIARRSRGE